MTRINIIRKFLASFRKRPKLIITYMYQHDLINFPPIKVKWDGKIEIRRININDIHLIRKVWPVSLEKMKKRLLRGDRCYATFLNDQIVMYQWFQSRGWHYIQPAGRWMRIRPGEIVCYHVRVAEWARGRRIAPFSTVFALQEYQQEGYRLAWAYTTSDNIASQKAKEHAGWIFIGSYRALSVGPFLIPLPGMQRKKSNVCK